MQRSTFLQGSGGEREEGTTREHNNAAPQDRKAMKAELQNLTDEKNLTIRGFLTTRQ
jgi:hypothetical protein